MSPLRLRYQTIEFGEIDIHVRTLRDEQQFFDPDDVALNLGISSATWPLFGVLWPSSLVLAHFLSDYDIAGKRILEVGCGIGLSSLLLNHLSADITATDYHPEAEAFMQANTMLNSDRDIPFVRTAWEDNDDDLGQFDLIVGSDILYEDYHIKLLANFIDKHALPNCEVIIVDPRRGRQAAFSKQMVLRGFNYESSRPEDPSYLEAQFKGKIHQFKRP